MHESHGRLGQQMLFGNPFTYDITYNRTFQLSMDMPIHSSKVVAGGYVMPRLSGRGSARVPNY